MAEFAEHVAQARRNLQFLERINQAAPAFFDWQVTVSFYAALHLVNAHLAQHGQQYRKHKDVKDVLNPRQPLSLAKLPDDEYVAYIALQSLSRRARYLVNEKDGKLGDTGAAFTYDKHLAKALRHLDTLMRYFDGRYGLGLSAVKVACVGMRYDGLRFVVG